MGDNKTPITASSSEPSASSPGNRLVRRSPTPMALEQRFVFDGAAAADVLDTAPAAAEPAAPATEPLSENLLLAAYGPVAESQSIAAESTAPEVTTSERPAADGNLFHQGEDNAALREAAAAATQLIQNYLAEASDEQLFVLFHGEQSSPDGQWSANLAQLRDAVANGSLDISLMLLDNAQLQGALAAYTPEGPQGAASIFINSDWLNVLDVQKVSSLLIEEYGHHIDHVLNQGMDTAGDEGQRFAAVVIGADTSAAGFATDNDHATLQIDGESIEVELANLSFSNAYAVNVASTPAGKESNSHDFIATGLGIASISDDTNSNLFSGNDVAAIGINIGGQEYFGWISRPIKSGGVVRGFYFWTDTNFNSLATAQADGNMDGDSNVADNRGFLLVVDQAWFDSLGWKDQAANLKNVGSSSDRVDSALNALLPVNSAPVASADNANATPGSAGGAAVEAGGLHNATSGYTASGNVLSNDLDANVGDTLAVIRAGTSAANLNVNAATTAASGTLVTGQYGNLTIGADGSYQYVVDNANAAVEALRSSTNTLSDTFTYTVADKAGATSTTTLTVTIQGANDTPTATNDYNVAKESLLSTGAYGASDPLGSQAIGNVLSNDSDPDRYGETKAIIGVGVEGAATGTTNSTVTFTTTVTTSGASSVKVDGAQYVYKLNDNGSRTQLFHANGTTPVTVLTKIGSGANLSFTFSDTSALQGITKFSFIDGTKYYDGTIDSTTVSSSTSVLVSAPSGTIAVGMTVGGTNLATAPTVTAVNYDASGNISSITLSTAVAITNQSLTFSAAASAGATLTGQYGSLQLNADGSYTYTPTANNPALSAGQSVVERFAYTMRDGAGATSSATLFITVLGSGANDPNAVADSVSATERGGVANATTGVDPTGNLLDNDTTPSGTKTIVSARSASVASNTAIGASDTQIVGLYGTLTLRANGTYTYAVNNDHASVQALNSTNSLTDTFVYTIENGQLLGSTPLRDSATLTVTIQGANDAPVASDDSATAIEAGGTGNASAGYNPSGNVLGNDSDIDDAASELRVTAVRTGSAEDSGTAGTPGSALAGSYGSLTLAADGNWSYVVDQSNAAVNALAPGQSLTERFNYTVTDRTGSGLSDIATLTITIQGASDTVAVNDVFVNEASEYAVFSVTGGAGVRVSLALSDTNGLPLGDRKASLTGSDADTGNPLQYLDGSTWKVYDAANPPVIPAGGALLVRVAINQDDIHEGNESFSLTATTSDGSASTGIGTINDEGEGAIYLAGNTSSTPDSATLDDDRPTLSIANVSVTEGEPAEFVVSLDKRSAAPISFTPLLASGTAIIGSDTAAATELQYHDGTGWAAVSGPVTIAAGELSVRLRLATVDDSEVEPAQSFSLSSGNVSGTVTNPLGATGTATILDNDTAVAGTPELDLDADNSSTATGADYRTSFTENGSAVAIADSDLSIVDADSANLASATIVLSNAKAGDSLSVGSLPAGISATVDTSVAGQITVTLSGNASKADYQAAIRAITFSNSSDAPDTSDRLVVVKVSDGASESNSALTTIAVVALNDAPTLADTALSLSFAEDAGAPSGAIGSPLSAFIGGIGDPDSGAVKGIAVIGSDETHGTWYYTTDGGNNWQAVGSVSASSALLLADTPSTRLYFKPTANFNGSIASGLTFKAWDRSSGTAGNRADTTLPPPSNSYTSSEPVVIPSSGSTGSVTLASSQTISGLNGPLTGVTITLNGLTHGWPQDLDILLVGPQGQKVLLMSDAGGGSSNAFNNLSLTFDDAATSSLPAVGEPVSSGTFRPTDLADGEGGDSFTGVSGPFASQLAEFIGTNPNGQWTLYISDDVVQFDGGSLASWTLTLHTPVDGPAFSTASDSIAVTVTPINDAPLASGSAILAPVAEDETAPPGASVSSLFAASFDDSTDQVAGGSSANSLAGIAITGYTADATKGDWQYSTDSGNNWITLTSIASDGSALTLQASALLRFLPAADYNGAAPDLTVRLIDSSTAVVSGATVDVSSNGGITAISADTVLLSTNVTAINDAPTGSDDSITTAEDTPKVLSTSDFGTFTDVDGDPLAKVIITTLASNGSLEYFDGTSWVAISRNQEISKADIDAGKLRFAPAADENGSPYASVGFKVSDGTATSSAEYTLTITVTPANDDFSDAGETLSVAEDSGATTGSLLSGSSSVDGPLSIASFSLAGQTGPFVLGSAYSVAGQGSITINADGSYSFTPAANWNGSFPVITYVVTDGSGANDSSTLTITVDPVNDAPVSSDDSLTIDEDTAVLLTIGDFGNFTDVDGDAITKVRITALATNGSLEYFDDTNWNAVLLNQEINKADIDAGKLRFVPGANENGSPYGSIGFKVSDGAAFSISANTLTIHVRPVSDPAVITGTNTGAVTEDANVDGNGKLNASGSLTISDADTGEAKFQTSGVVAAPGTLGSLTIDTNGAWTYNVANSAVQYLKQGETKLETFTVRALDGTTHQVVVTIHGVNDAALIGGTNTGAVTEDANVDGSGKLNASGSLNISDADNGEASFHSGAADISAAPGTLGSLTIDANGAWSYSVANSAVQYLKAGETRVETFTVKAVDGTEHQVEVTITGVNDTAVIGGTNTGAVTEDASSPNLTDSGNLTIADADTGEAKFQTSGVVAAPGTLGSLTIDANGAWSYSVANSAVQYLKQGETRLETFTVKAVDGTEHQVEVTITGVNDAAVIGGDAEGAVTEDASSPNLTDSGNLTIADADSGEAKFRTGVVAADGTLGSLTIDANGAWTYSVANSDVQYLKAGETRVETFTVKAVDGTEHQVEVTITGVNDAAVIGGDAEGAVTEDASSPNLTDSGNLTIADADSGEAKFRTGVVAADGTLGSLTIDANGAWTYSVANSDVQYLKAGETRVETFTVKAVDGTEHQVEVTITGVNDAAVIGGTNTGAVTEDADVDTDGNLSDSGQLSISDADSGEAKFQTSGIVAAPGTLGSLTLSETGAWSYSVVNADVQYLKAGETRVETFTVKAVDGTEHQVEVTITGVNDAAVIGGTNTGAVTEDADVDTDGNLSDSGQLSISDADSGEAKFQTSGVVAAPGTLGSLTIDANGAWSYSVANSAVQYLKAGETRVETFTVKAVDGTEHQVEVTITGVNDAAVIGGDAEGAVTEDASSPNLTDSGNLTIADADSGEAKFRTGVVAADGTLGSLTIDTNGAWTYSVANSAVQYLKSGETRVETFTVKAVDGTEHQVEVTITGVNDAAVIGGDAEGAVTEDASSPNLTDSGNLTIADADSGEAKFRTGVVAAPGTLGSLSIDANGAWTYSVANSAVQYLKAGETRVETFTVKAVDGTEHQVEVTITGVNDAALIGGTNTGAVTEDLNVDGSGKLNASGSLTISDADNGEAKFRTGVVAADGTLGSLTIDANGAWTYSVANSVVQYLKAGETKVETFTVKAVDGTEHQVQVTITGVNDAALITGNASGSVQEDTTLSTGGRLAVSDVDSGQAAFVAQQGVVGSYGSFTIDASGNWNYLLDNDARHVQRLTSSETMAERFTVQTLDGTSRVIEIDVRGLDDVPPTPPQPPAPAVPTASEPPAAPSSPSPAPTEAPAIGNSPLQTALADARPTISSGGSATDALDPVQSAALSDVYTSNSGFRVVVMDAPEPTLAIYRGMGDQYADAGAASSFSIPYDAFVHSDPQARVVLAAMQANGEQLPDWVVFNPLTGKFEVRAPAGFRGDVAVKVVARDSQGREVSALFRISVGEKPSTTTGNGRAGLSEQLRMAAKRPAFALADLSAAKTATTAQAL